MFTHVTSVLTKTETLNREGYAMAEILAAKDEEISLLKLEILRLNEQNAELKQAEIRLKNELDSMRGRQDSSFGGVGYSFEAMRDHAVRTGNWARLKHMSKFDSDDDDY
jgi:hypothetical protein